MSEINVRFFVEGHRDAKLVMDLVEQYFDFTLNFKEHFIVLSSWSDYKNKTQKFHEYSDLNYINLLIIDNDVVGRRAEVESDLNILNAKAELFLLPNDDRIGELEHLLSDIAQVKTVINCFEKYEDCIKDFEPVDPKGKIFAYLDALLSKEEKGKDGRNLKDSLLWNFRNQAHWNLQHEALNPLLEFLRKHIVIS